MPDVRYFILFQSNTTFTLIFLQQNYVLEILMNVLNLHERTLTNQL